LTAEAAFAFAASHIGSLRAFARVNVVNIVNVGERYKGVTFTTYPPETKGLVNVVNVGRGYFESAHTSLPNRSGTGESLPG